FHALQERRLRLRAGAVDLVTDDDVREDWPRTELESARALVEHGDTGDVRRQQVGSELDAIDRAIEGTGQSPSQHGLADARNILDQQVSLGEELRQRELDGLGLAVDDRLYAAND